MTPKEFIKTWFANIDAKKFSELQNMVDSKHQFTNPMTPAPIAGEQHLGMIRMMTSALDGKHILDVVVSEGDWVTARGHWTGTHTGEFNGIPATGNRVEFSFIDMMHVENRKLTDEYFEMNPMAMMQQIGGTPAQ